MHKTKDTNLPIVRLTVEGTPVAQKRHRHTSVGKFVRTYDPSSKDKSDFLALCFNQIPKKLGLMIENWEGSLRLDLKFIMPIPKSYSKKKKLSLLNADHLKKPDIDNMIKFVMDALNKIFWKDDSQVSCLYATKIYGSKPRTEITITYNNI